MLLACNFGDGRINVRAKHGARYARQVTGQVRGTSTGKPFAEPGLWGLLPGTATTGGTDAFWFTVGADPRDADVIRAITTAAFALAGRRPDPARGQADRQARAGPAWLQALSLVAATPAGEVIGHVPSWARLTLSASRSSPCSATRVLLPVRIRAQHRLPGHAAQAGMAAALPGPRLERVSAPAAWHVHLPEPFDRT